MAFLDSLLIVMSYFALMMGMISFWVKRTFWLWGALICIAILLGYVAKIVDWRALVPIVALGACEWLLYHKKVSHRVIFISISIAISFGLSFHLFPGFHNWKMASQLVLSPGAVPYNFWINFDKPFMGIFLLAWALPIIQTKAHMHQVLKRALPLSILGVTLMIALSIHFGIVKWDPKMTLLLALWPLVNLFFVVIPEEAFFRGFMQQELFRYFKSLPAFNKTVEASQNPTFLCKLLANSFAVGITALVFMLLHISWIKDVGFLSLVFIAGCIYGAIYQYTRAIESSILCHFLLNLVHFIFFTYPMLAR